MLLHNIVQFSILKHSNQYNRGEVIDKSKAPKLESKQLTAETCAEIVGVLSMWKKQEEIEQLGDEEAKAYDKFKQENISLWHSD